jgi:hypothetical protein
MPQIHTSKAARVSAIVALAIASIVLTACGSSSKGSATATASASSSPSPGASGSRGGRFAAVRECLAKNGITLPPRSPGQGRGGGLFPGGPGGGPQLPRGVTRAQFEAALKKCGGLGRGGLGGARRLKDPAFKQALAKFAACMRENGVQVPEPNTSGKGPIFNTSGLNTNSAGFRNAELKCRAAVPGVLPGRRGAPGAGSPPTVTG